MRRFDLCLAGAAALAAGWSGAAAAAEQLGPVTISGYVRQDFSLNLQDVPETPTHDDAFDLQMNRQTVFVEAFMPLWETRWTARARYVHEFTTPYEERLEAQASAFTQGALGLGAVDFSDEYEGLDLREFFVDFDTGRVAWRIGKQQVVWGETDFFHATDVIHGYDFRWRHFLEPANEDVRKPLSMVNATIDAPELNGKMQIVVRPPVDPDDQVGNFDPTFGGRWSNNTAKGFPLASSENPALARYNYDWRDGDTDEAHYGARWVGAIGDVDYSLSYYHGQGGFQQDPILVADPTAPFGLSFVLPFTDTYGASVTGYIPAIDSVYRAEVAYTPDRMLANFVTGAVVENDAWNIVVGLDHTLRLQDYVGTSAPSLFTVQLFDWFLPGVDTADQLVRFDGAGFYDQHNVYASVILQLPYLHDTLTATLVGLADLTQGGGLFIPSLEYALGERWRIKGELDLPIGGNKGPTAANASTFGALEHNSQFLLRTTFLF